VAEIVSSYVRHHQIAADQLAGLIVEVHRALAGLGRPPPAQEPPTPAVPIRRSVRQDYVVCLECGFRAQVRKPADGRSVNGLRLAKYMIENHPARRSGDGRHSSAHQSACRPWVWETASPPSARCVSRSARSAVLCNRHAAEGCRGGSPNPRQNKSTPNPT
jgi:hypothetical protein